MIRREEISIWSMVNVPIEEIPKKLHWYQSHLLPPQKPAGCCKEEEFIWGLKAIQRHRFR